MRIFDRGLIERTGCNPVPERPGRPVERVVAARVGHHSGDVVGNLAQIRLVAAVVADGDLARWRWSSLHGQLG